MSKPYFFREQIHLRNAQPEHFTFAKTKPITQSQKPTHPKFLCVFLERSIFLVMNESLAWCGFLEPFGKTSNTLDHRRGLLCAKVEHRFQHRNFAVDRSVRHASSFPACDIFADKSGSHIADSNRFKHSLKMVPSNFEPSRVPALIVFVIRKV